jgi:hypothetical protein
VRLFIIISLLTISVISCTKKEKTWGPQEMWFHALAQDPSIELVGIPNHEAHRRVLCENYAADGCIEGSGKRVKVRLVELLVIQYKTPKQACLAAKAIGQWYARNWLLDDVTNEPVLESYVAKIFDAKKADKCL